MSSPDVKGKLAELSGDEPLRAISGVDMICLLMQSPWRLFLYWLYAGDPFTPLYRALGSQADSYELVIRLIERESRDEKLFKAPASLRYWFDVRPGFSYVADVGFHAEGKPFIRVLTSNVVNMPRTGFAFSHDRAKLCSASVPDFVRLLNETGYARDTIEYLLAEADQLTNSSATRSVATRFLDELEDQVRREFGDDYVENREKIRVLDAGDYKVEDLRVLLADIALGKSHDEYDEDEEQLPSELQSWFSLIFYFIDWLKTDGVFDTMRLMGIIQSVICNAPDCSALFAQDEAALQRRAQDDTSHNAHFYVWMPSEPQLKK